MSDRMTKVLRNKRRNMESFSVIVPALPSSPRESRHLKSMPRRPGRPRSTPADRVARLALRVHRRLRLQFEAQHLREAAAVLAAWGERCSLRIQYIKNTAAADGKEPWYRLIHFGEPGYLKGHDPPPPDGYIILVTKGEEDEDY